MRHNLNTTFAMNDLIPLSMLRSGESGVVEQVLGLPDHVHRLSELGVRQGASLEMLQPGDPCIVQLPGGKLGLRGGDNLSVLVRPRAGA